MKKILKKYKILVDPDKFNKIKYKVLKKYEKLPDFEAVKPTKFYEMCFNKLRVKVKKKTMEKMQKELDEIYLNSIELIKGARKVLNILSKKYTLVLVSDTMNRRVRKILKRFKLEKFFDRIITPEMYGKKKNLFPLKKIIKLYKIKPNEMVVVGDSKENDVIPAQKIGASYIKVGTVKPGETYKWHAKDISEVKTIIDSIEQLELTLVLDYDGIVNNELKDLLNAFDKTAKKFSIKINSHELLAKYILYDEVYGNLEWKEIIEKVIENKKAADYFTKILKYTPNLDLFEFLKKHEVEAIIVSRSLKGEIEKFLEKWKLKKYISKVYGKAPKWSIKFWKELKLPKKTVVIGDKVYDIIIPMVLGYKTILINPFEDIRKILYDDVLMKHN